MKGVDTIARIRREFFVRGKTIKQISRELHIARNTVRKVLRSGATEFRYEREVPILLRMSRLLDQEWAPDGDYDLLEEEVRCQPGPKGGRP